jgi:hypothetical protein
MSSLEFAHWMMVVEICSTDIEALARLKMPPAAKFPILAKFHQTFEINPKFGEIIQVTPAKFSVKLFYRLET